MKIWVDDIRPAPEGWVWFKSSNVVCEWMVAMLMSDTPFKVDVMSLDHDLGGDDTTRPIVMFFCLNDWWPDEVRVHSANPPGVYWLESMIERYHPSNAHKYTR